MSQLDDEDRVGIYSYVYGFDKDGLPIRDCSKCSETFKEKMGCGFDEKYKGKGGRRGKAKDDSIDYKGICPAWYKNSPFVNDFVRMLNWKDNLGLMSDLPNRFLQSLEYYEYISAVKRAEEKDK